MAYDQENRREQRIAMDLSVEITRYDLYSVLPYHETIWRGDLSGSRLKQLLNSPTTYGGAMRSTVRESDIVPGRVYKVAATTFLAQSVLPGGEDTGVDSRIAAEEWLATQATHHRSRLGVSMP